MQIAKTLCISRCGKYRLDDCGPPPVGSLLLAIPGCLAGGIHVLKESIHLAFRSLHAGADRTLKRRVYRLQSRAVK
jgi:hypothetical protein